MTFGPARSHQPERRTALLQLWAGLERGRPPGDAGDPVRDRLGEQDLHRHPRRLCLTQDKMRLDDRASQHWPALQGSRFDGISLLDLATYTAGGCRCSFPTRCRRTRHRSATTTASGSRPTRRAASASIPTRASACWLSRRAQPGPAVRTAHGAASVPGTGPRTDPPRRARAALAQYAQGYGKDDRPLRVGPGPLDAEGYRGEDQRGRPAALRRCQPASGRLDRPWAQALDATHRGYPRSAT